MNLGADKITAARMCGLVIPERSTVTLTELGRRIVDGSADECRDEIGEAFQSVELYRALYGRYEGYALPPAAALEREMVSLGVSSKQTERARQAFERSARYAGFISVNGRFVRPAAQNRSQAAATAATEPASQERRQTADGTRRGTSGSDGGDSNVDELDLDPLITGLLRRLPPIEKTWPARERVRWLQALNVNLGIIYGPSEIEEIKVILNDLGS